MFKKGYVVVMPLAAAAAWYALRITHSFIFAATRLSLTIDPVIAPPLALNIDRYCHQHFSSRDPLASIVNIRRQFPVIERMTSRKNLDGTMSVTVEGVPIKAMVSDTLVIDADGRFLDARIINEAVRAQLAYIHVKNPKAPEFAAFVRDLDARVLAEYSVTWRGLHNIDFVPLNGDSFKILASYDRQPALCVLEACKRLYQQFQSEKVHSSKAKIFVADTRFRGQIVTYLDKGGNGDGNSIF